MADSDVTESSRNRVDNNHIFDGGHVYAAGVGVWVAQSSHNRIAHNDIHDLRYSGMSIGWNWNNAPNRCHHNVIEYNHVHHVVNGVLSDAGAIYTLGVSPGSVIRNNVLHDVWPYDTPPFGWGVYLDATTGGYLVENNLVYNIQSGGLMFSNGGHENVIINNIFALCAHYAIWPYWGKQPNTLRRNIVYLTQGHLFVPFAESTLRERLRAGEPLGAWERNCYWHTGAELRFFREGFEDWQSLGLDRTSRMVDPDFVAAADYDFRLKPDSPARAMGFKPIDTSRVGLHGDAAWREEARTIKHPPTVLPPAPQPPKPREVEDGFENSAVGSRPEGAHVSGEEQGAAIRVSDDNAAAGRHSLKVADSKNLKPTWQPHFYYTPHVRMGTVIQSFDVLLAPDTQMFAEWRDSTPYPECVGPSIAFGPGGRITVGGRLLATGPPGQWIHVKIEATLGEKTFTLTVTLPGRTPRTFSDQRMSGTRFEELHWLGFSSTAAAATAFYLDNLSVRRTRP
jgi:hypothetical protein